MYVEKLYIRLMARSMTADARIALRLPTQMKERFEAAAEANGHSSLSDFILTTLQERSAAILQRERRLIQLSPEEYKVIRIDIDSSQGPSEKARKFFMKYGKNFIPSDRAE